MTSEQHTSRQWSPSIFSLENEVVSRSTIFPKTQFGAFLSWSGPSPVWWGVVHFSGPTRWTAFMSCCRVVNVSHLPAPSQWLPFHVGVVLCSTRSVQEKENNTHFTVLTMSFLRACGVSSTVSVNCVIPLFVRCSWPSASCRVLMQVLCPLRFALQLVPKWL